MERQFKGVWIPSGIWLNQDLAPIDKCILAEVDSFSGNGRYYFKSNGTMSEEIGVSIATIKRSVKKLMQMGLIEVEGGSRRKISSTWEGQNELGVKKNGGHIDLEVAHNDPEVGHIAPVEGHIDPHTNTSTNTSTNTTTNKGVVLPFEEEVFIEAWKIWIDERKQNKRKKYTFRGEQSALHKLQKDANNDVHLAIEMIHHAIANTWTGIHPIKNGKQTNKNRGFDKEKYGDYLNTL